MDREMELVNYENVNLGQKVVLVYPDEEYTLDQSNPVRNGPYACEGTIVGFDGSIEVEWDNGNYNGYKNGELAFAKPPAEGICKSIW